MPKDPSRLGGKSQRKAAGTVDCEWCDRKAIPKRGIASHKKACPRRPDEDNVQSQGAPSALPEVLHESQIESPLEAIITGVSSTPLASRDAQGIPSGTISLHSGSGESGSESDASEDPDEGQFSRRSVIMSALQRDVDNDSSESEEAEHGTDDYSMDEADMQPRERSSVSPILEELGDAWSRGTAHVATPHVDNITQTESRPNLEHGLTESQPTTTTSSRIHETANSSFTSSFSRIPGEPEPEENEIRVEYHPKSGRGAAHFSFYEFTPDRAADVPDSVMGRESDGAKDPDIEKPPWRPFSSRLDFELADLVLETHMNSQQTDRLLDLIRKCIADPKSFTLLDDKEMKQTWEAARKVHTNELKHSPLTVPYPVPGAPENTLEFDFWHQSLWDWCNSLLDNPNILPQFRWHAQRIFKWDDSTSTFKRHIDEPWTADAFWRIESKLPGNGVPFCIILYADKTQLSSFGTAKAYPVLARCANLPADIRNGNGLGGGRLVGWLPIVEEDSEETKKPRFIKLKRVVWHTSFKKILEELVSLAYTGRYKQCIDGILRFIFPVILILSADYEEQCFMAAIRGLRSAHPCPVCIVHESDMTSPIAAQEAPLRTAAEMQGVYNHAQSLGLQKKSKQKEKVLREVGLRDVENAFWALEHTDVYSAISWDRLHAYHGGLFSRHLWRIFQTLITDKDVGLGKRAAKLIDTQTDMVPRWSGLYHFSAIMQKGDFYTDGRKYEDMSKIIVFISHNVLSADASPAGYILLQLIRSYLELDMYASLLLHSADTIESGENELLRFHAILEEFKSVYPDKEWNFPKAHSHMHMFRDIRMKGVTRNYNSKPNESAHRPLKKFYLFRSNFKDVAEQILRLDANTVASTIIKSRIEAFDDLNESLEANRHDSEFVPANPDSDTSDEPLMARVAVGSKLKPTTIGDIASLSFPELPEKANAFKDFRKKLSAYLQTVNSQTEVDRHRDSNRPSSLPRITDDSVITPYQSLKVHYESVVEWANHSNILRCNPSFHHRERYDYALIKVDDNSFIFAQLLYLFSIRHGESTHTLALILPMDIPPPLAGRSRDSALRFTRVIARPFAKSAIVDVNSIVRGALLVREYGAPFEIAHTSHIVVDTVDADMWWRMKSITLARHVKI